MPAQTHRTLCLYPVTFPNESIEPYLLNELPYLARFFDNVLIVPLQKKPPSVELPPNVRVIHTQDLPDVPGKRALFFRNFRTIISIMSRELVACRSKRFFLQRFRLTLSELLNAFILSEKFKIVHKNGFSDAVHYSFWMNEPALALSILKEKKLIRHFVFRVHGYDLYEERHPYGYIPFRHRCYNLSSGVFPISKMGVDYIKRKYGTYTNVAHSYLGTLDNGLNPYPPDTFTIVSCSSIIPLKRLHLLAQALLHVNMPVVWYHFGEGKKEAREKLLHITAKYPETRKAVFMGQRTQKELCAFYAEVPVTLFVNVSETEGLPVSMMESISFGIPVLATNVGGVSEIVTQETGWVVDKNITESGLAAQLNRIASAAIDWPEFRKQVRAFWKNNFSAEKNYTGFCKRISELN